VTGHFDDGGVQLPTTAYEEYKRAEEYESKARKSLWLETSLRDEFDSLSRNVRWLEARKDESPAIQQRINELRVRLDVLDAKLTAVGQ
jgi:hypothetical protein